MFPPEIIYLSSPWSIYLPNPWITTNPDKVKWFFSCILEKNSSVNFSHIPGMNTHVFPSIQMKIKISYVFLTFLYPRASFSFFSNSIIKIIVFQLFWCCDYDLPLTFHDIPGFFSYLVCIHWWWWLLLLFKDYYLLLKSVTALFFYEYKHFYNLWSPTSPSISYQTNNMCN